MSNLAVTALTQDHEGFVWVGTQNGIFRYDGFGFDSFPLDSSLPTQNIQNTLIDPSGRLWIAVEDALGYLQNGAFHTVRFEGKNLKMTNGSTVTSDRTGTLYAASNGRLLSIHLNPQSHVWEVAERQLPGPAPNRKAHGVLATTDGSLTVGCGQGLCTLTAKLWHIWGTESGLPEDSWSSLLESSRGDLWARGTRFIAVRKSGESHFRSFPLPGVRSPDDTFTLAEDKQGRILTCTGTQLARWDGTKWELFGEEQGVARYKIMSILVDHSGAVWLGYLGHGLVRWLGYDQWEHWTKAQGLESDLIWSIQRDKQGRLWVGSEGGLAYLQPGAAHFTQWIPPAWMAGESVQGLALSADGALWFGTYVGHAVRLDPQSNRVTNILVDGKVSRVLADKRNRIWIAAGSGLYRVDLSARQNWAATLKAQSVISGAVQDVVQSENGDIFARVSNTLIRIDDAGVHSIQLPPDLQIGGQWAELATDGIDSIWTDAISHGLAHLWLKNDRIVRAEHFTRGALMSDATVILERDHRGRIWVGEDHGIDIFDGAKWRHLSQENGLIWNDCDSKAFFEDTDGSVWIGTSGGLSHLLNHTTHASGVPLRLAAVSATLGTHDLTHEAHVSLPWSKSPLTVKFGLLNSTDESAVKLRYRLLNLEQNWISTDARTIRYPQLSPGTYTLEAVATDTATGEDSAVYRLSIIIVPPWWRTGTALFLASLLVIVSTVGVWRWRVRSLVRRQRELEATVAERTEELRSKKAEAEAASRAKSEFLAVMSHEIRTPMNGVLGMASLLAETPLTGQQLDWVNTIRHSGDLLLTVLNDILDFSKIEAGKLDLEHIEFNLPAVLADCRALIDESVRRKQLHYTTAVASDVPQFVFGDPTRLRQIILNLLSNAVKFTHSGSIRLNVTAEPLGSTQSKLYFEVIDSGIGMDRATLSRIFSSFSQADTSTTRKYGGTGLGLAIAKRLIELMGGRIEAESEKGVGTRFSFEIVAELPQRHTDLRAPQGGSTVVPEASCPHSRGTILLAEDNAINQKVALHMLQRLGFTVDLAGNGHQAVELARSNHYDLILMDCQMPEMDGFEAAKIIRAFEEDGLRTPIIAATANAFIEDKERCLLAGMDGHLSKPITKESLDAVLQKWIGAPVSTH